MTQESGAELIAAERRRQVEKEGWTPEHDDEHANFEMLEAAWAYMKAVLDPPEEGASMLAPPLNWPWEPEWWKPSDDPVRNLVKTGALIAADIDRLLRAQEGTGRL